MTKRRSHAVNVVRRAALLTLLFHSLDVRADLVDSVAKLKPSVILIGTYNPLNSPRFNFRGTGFIVDDGRRAITNAHVLPEAGKPEASDALVIQVLIPGLATAPQWSMRAARLLAEDRVHDLALLSFEGVAGNPVVLSTQAPREGLGVAFMGFPIGGALGFAHVTHRGIISSIATMAMPQATAQQLNPRAIAQLRRGSFDVFQLDATAYPGNSGGPIFDLETAEVLGVINSVLVKGSRESALTQPSGISYGIPIEHAGRLIQDNR